MNVPESRGSVFEGIVIGSKLQLHTYAWKAGDIGPGNAIVSGPPQAIATSSTKVQDVVAVRVNDEPLG